jgi:Flp pilus assembly pilin Flp
MIREAVVVGHTGNVRSKRGLLATAKRSFSRIGAFSRWLYRQDGQTFGEYSLILTLVVVVAAAGLSPFGTNLGTFITNTVTAVATML